MSKTIYQCPECGEEWSKPHCPKCADACSEAASEAKPPQAVSASASGCPSARAPGDHDADTSSHCPDNSDWAAKQVWPSLEAITLKCPRPLAGSWWLPFGGITTMRKWSANLMQARNRITCQSSVKRVDSKPNYLLMRQNIQPSKPPTLTRSGERARPGNNSSA